MAQVIPMGPMTTIVVLVIATSLLVGIGIITCILFGGTDRTSNPKPRVCPNCKTDNPHHAGYCSQCGRRLGKS